MAGKLQRHLAEVTERAEGLATRATPARLDQGEIVRLGIRVPDVRRAQKAGYSFSVAPAEEQLGIWDFIWRHSSHYEVMSQALYAYQHRQLKRKEVTIIRQWVERCTCWEHSDDLSKIYATVVEENPGWMVPTLQSWNRSNNAWKRRQSMVSLIEYASKRRRFLPFEQLIAFIEPLLGDEEYYVQKGLGWTLREIHNAYPEETADYLNRRALAISPRAWSAATEKLNTADKARLNAARKAARQGNPPATDDH